MESPLDYLKAAVYEEDEEKRLEKIITGCKLITDALPFDKRIEAVSKIPNLVQYLLLNSLFSTNSITMILNSLLDKFRDSHDFIEIFWSGVEFCSKLTEVDANSSQQQEDFKFVANDQSFTQLRQNKYAQYTVSVPSVEYNSMIQLNVVRIKYIAISFIYDLYTIYANDKMISMDDKNGIFITFLHNSYDEKFILSVIEQVEQIKSTFLFYFHSIMDFDDQVEEVIRTKAILNRQNSDKLKLLNEQSTWDSQSLNSPLLQNNLQSTMAQKSRFSENTDINKMNIALESHDVMSEEDSFNQASEVTVFDQIEEWMVSDNQYLQIKYKFKKYCLYYSLLSETFNIYFQFKNLCIFIKIGGCPIIGKNDFMLNFFKLEENIELILGFILDPLVHLPTKIWQKTYPRIRKDVPLRDMRAFKLGINPILELQPKVINAIMMRSYKLVTILSDRRNLRVACNAFPDFFDLIYFKIYEFFRNNEQANLYHVGKLIDSLIKFSPDYSFYFVMQNNLMFNMIDYIYNPQINQVLNGISNVQWNTYKFTEEVANMILEYIFASGFITELSSLIVQNEVVDSFKRDKQFKKREIIAMQNKIQNQRNEDIKYRKKTEPIMMPAENLISAAEQQTNKEYLDEVMGISSSHLEREYFSMKELIGLRPDIDGIKKIKAMKKLSHAELMKQKQMLSSSYIPEMNSVENLPNEDEEEENRKELVPQSTDGLTNHISPSVIKLRKANFRLSFIRMTKKENMETMLDKNAKRHSKQLIENDVPSPADKKVNNTKKRTSQLAVQAQQAQQLDNFIQSFTTTNSFSSGKLKTVYPNTNLLMVNSEIEVLSKEREFFSERIIQKEMYAIPGSQMLHGLIYEAINYNDNKVLYEKVKLNHMTESKKNQIFKIFFDFDAKIFQKLIMNYLIKIRVLSKLKDNQNSAYETGKIINLILQKISEFPQQAEYFKKIHQICKDVFDFACKTLIYMHSSKRDNFYLQNFKVVNPLGSCKLVLFETICLILKNDSFNSCDLISKVSDTTWHVIIIQFFNHPKLFAEINQLVLTYGKESALKNILFKLNCLSSLSNAYDNIVRNSVIMYQWHIDTFLIYIRQIVSTINTYSDSPNFKQIKQFLMQSASWNFLRHEILPPQQQVIQSHSHLPSPSRKSKNVIKVHSSINLTLDKSQVFTSPDAHSKRESQKQNLAKSQLNNMFNKTSSKMQLPPILTASQVSSQSKIFANNSGTSTKLSENKKIGLAPPLGKLSNTTSLTELGKKSYTTITSAGNLDQKKDKNQIVKKKM